MLGGMYGQAGTRLSTAGYVDASSGGGESILHDGLLA